MRYCASLIFSLSSGILPPPCIHAFAFLHVGARIRCGQPHSYSVRILCDAASGLEVNREAILRTPASRASLHFGLFSSLSFVMCLHTLVSIAITISLTILGQGFRFDPPDQIVFLLIVEALPVRLKHRGCVPTPFRLGHTSVEVAVVFHHILPLTFILRHCDLGYWHRSLAVRRLAG